jgi:hypothetical protein
MGGFFAAFGLWRGAILPQVDIHLLLNSNKAVECAPK